MSFGKALFGEASGTQRRRLLLGTAVLAIILVVLWGFLLRKRIPESGLQELVVVIETLPPTPPSQPPQRITLTDVPRIKELARIINAGEGISDRKCSAHAIAARCADDVATPCC